MKKQPKDVEPVESLGQTWLLSKTNPAIREAFAAKVLARAIRRLNSLKKTLDEEEYKARKDELEDRIDAGAYDWGPPVEIGGTGPGKAIHAYFNLGDGNMDLLQFLLCEEHGELSREKVQSIFEGNPEGVQAAFRAAHGLPPLAVPPSQEPEGEEANETAPEPTASGAA